MRLLHLTSLEFKEFFNNEIPSYANLSHRWGEDEVSFKDMRKKHNLEGRRGFAKIQEFCAFARNWRRKGYAPNVPEWIVKETTVEWGWVDTCCIDKTSSAELSEAINSMFSWYRKSAFCCVYLTDMPSSWAGVPATREAFRKSEWVTRGWTLQELLAPKTLLFCNADWKVLSHKCSNNCDREIPGCPQANGQPLNNEVSWITGIQSDYLKYARDGAQQV